MFAIKPKEEIGCIAVVLLTKNQKIFNTSPRRIIITRNPNNDNNKFS